MSFKSHSFKHKLISFTREDTLMNHAIIEFFKRNMKPSFLIPWPILILLIGISQTGMQHNSCPIETHFKFAISGPVDTSLNITDY